jgi:hypothetical protein
MITVFSLFISPSLPGISAMKRKKTGSMATTLASDSDSDEDALPRSREEGLFHRGIRTNAQGQTNAAMTRLVVPASPVKRPPQRDMLESGVSPMTDWNMGEGGGVDPPFPFAGEDFFAFDEGHPVDQGRRKERDSVSYS